MGEIRLKLPVLPIMAVFAPSERILDNSQSIVTAALGEIVLESPTFRFDVFTAYYSSSMGSELYKRFWAFKKLSSPEFLAKMKVKTNEIEADVAQELRINDSDMVKRPLNLDPGYIDLGKLVLASTKDHSHRIYLQKGVFAEVTLIYTQKHWQSLPWTYPDYQSAEYHRFFDQCREFLHQELKQMIF